MFTDSGMGKRYGDDFLLYRLHTEPGQSGSPIFKETEGGKHVIGIHIGACDELKYNVALLLNETIKKQIN